MTVDLGAIDLKVLADQRQAVMYELAHAELLAGQDGYAEHISLLCGAVELLSRVFKEVEKQQAQMSLEEID